MKKILASLTLVSMVTFGSWASGTTNIGPGSSVSQARLTRCPDQTSGRTLRPDLGPVACLAASLVLQNTLGYVSRNAVLSTRQPLFLPIAFMVAVVSLYLGLSAALGVARERDRGTLSVLLFGPVDEPSAAHADEGRSRRRAGRRRHGRHEQQNAIDDPFQ